jgi:hypothetical protein
VFSSSRVKFVAKVSEKMVIAEVVEEGSINEG